MFEVARIDNRVGGERSETTTGDSTCKSNGPAEPSGPDTATLVAMVHLIGSCVVDVSDVAPTVAAGEVGADCEPEPDVVAEQATMRAATADTAIHRNTTIRSTHPKAHIARYGARWQVLTAVHE